MMVGMENLVPKWLHGRSEPDLGSVDDMPPLPEVASLPTPKPPSEEDSKLAVIAQAHVYVEQLRHEREADRLKIEQLQVELAEVVLLVESEKKKSAMLELDLAQALNNVQTLQTQIEEYRRFMDIWKDANDKTRQVFDRFGIQGTPKKEPKRQKKDAANRPEADPPAQADG